MLTSMSPKPRLARCVFSFSSESAAALSGTSRRSSLATARCGKIVLPPGPVYPPTNPSMFTVGRPIRRSSASVQLASCTQCSPPSSFFAAFSSMRCAAAQRMDENAAKKLLGGEHWVHDASWTEALERLMGRPTVNIEGLVGGYTGPGGKTILPHRAVAKLDLRLVPDRAAADSLEKLKTHLAKRGFGDIEVNMTGGYDPTSTPRDAAVIRAQQAVDRRSNVEPILLPRNAGSWPGYVFTGDPLKLAAGHFGLGHGSGAHAPDEYYVIESANPKVQGIDGGVRSYVELLYELARTRMSVS